MKRFRMPRPRHSTVAAYLALFVALGGTSYAALKLPRNSVGPKQLKADAVRSGKVKNRSLLARDFKLGQLPAGPRGLTGSRGLRGLPGAPGLSGYRVTSNNSEGTTDSNEAVAVECAPGERIMSGGYEVTGGDAGDRFSARADYIDEEPSPLPDLYRVSIDRTGGATNWGISAYAVCAKVAP